MKALVNPPAAPEEDDPPPMALWRQTMQEQQKAGFGGALLLVAIGRVVAPVFIAYGLGQSLVSVSKPGIWRALTSPDSPAYHPLWGGLLIYEIVGWVSLLLTSLLLLWLLSQRRRAFIVTIIAYLAVFIVFRWGDVLISAGIPRLRENAVFDGLIFAAVQATVFGAIWIPYFLVSERVRNTFTR